MAKYNVKLESNVSEFKGELARRLPIILDAIGQEAEGDAMETLRNRVGKSEWYVPTGRLMNSITHQVVEGDKEDIVYIGTNVEYAPYVEFGTGIYADDGDGRKTPWAYKGNDGKIHFTHGMKPKHFLKDGVVKNVKKYNSILKEGLQ